MYTQTEIDGNSPLTPDQKNEIQKGIEIYLLRIEKDLKRALPDKVNEVFRKLLLGLLKGKFKEAISEVQTKYRELRINQDAIAMLQSLVAGQLSFFLNTINFSRVYSFENISLKEKILEHSKRILKEESDKRSDANYSLENVQMEASFSLANFLAKKIFPDMKDPT